MPKSVIPATTQIGIVCEEKKCKHLAVLAKTPWLKLLFPAKLLSSNVKMVTLTRAPENIGETHDISFEAPFTLRLAGYFDMLFLRCFVCKLWLLLIVRVNVVSCRVTL